MSKKLVQYCWDAKNWVSRITSLLDVIVSRDHGLSLCIKCKLRIVSLEKSLADLEAFIQLVPSFSRAYTRPAKSFYQYYK